MAVEPGRIPVQGLGEFFSVGLNDKRRNHSRKRRQISGLDLLPMSGSQSHEYSGQRRASLNI